MVYDFGLMKWVIKDLIDSFDHGVTLWSGDDGEYIAAMKRFSKRWIVLPVSPSAEQFARVIFLMVERAIACTQMQNGERNVLLHSIIVHETDTGYAQAFGEDAYSEKMGKIPLEQIHFSDQIKREWNDPELWDKLRENQQIILPKQV